MYRTIRRPHTPVQRAPDGDRNALPAGLKSGVELLSGLSMDDVRVHRGSSAPAALGAPAFARGTDIHLGPGQEDHLPHETWHVAQFKKGRVRATTHAAGMDVSDDVTLETEADRMGQQALSAGRSSAAPAVARTTPVAADGPVQLGQKELTEWKKQKGYRTKGDVVAAIEELFRQRKDDEAHALLLEHNEVAEKSFLTIKPEDVDGYRAPSDQRMVDRQRRATGARTYLAHEPVQEGDLVYGLGETRDNYVFSNQQPYNVVDDLNNQFLGTRAGSRYGAVNVPAENRSSADAARELQGFLERYKPPKAPSRTPGEDDVSVNARLRRASKYGMAFTAQRGRNVRFVLDRIDQEDVVRKRHRFDTGSAMSNDKMRAITGTELRFLYRNRMDPGIRDSVEFYSDSRRLDAAPWESDPELWSRYVPKGEASVKGRILRNIELNVHRIVNSTPRESQPPLRQFAREYLRLFLGHFDAVFGDLDLDTSGDEIVQFAHQDFGERLQGILQ